MARPTFQQLLCFDAVVSEGSFQAAANRLGRSHPTVFAAIKKLETQLGVRLFDRRGYRVSLTEAGRSLHTRARVVMSELASMENQATQLAMGEEVALSAVIGDLSPLRETLHLLRRFFDGCTGTRLHLHFEAISGPWERLFDHDADLIIHHSDVRDSNVEFIELCDVQVIPVVAPGFLDFSPTRGITPEQMRPYVQCIIRDTARHSPARDYYLVDGARSWTVNDQLMKKELILQGMGWGHMPTFMIEEDLRAGRLLSIAGRHFPGARGTLVAARLRAAPHGPVASRLWKYLEAHAEEFAATIDPSAGSSRKKIRVVSRSR
jgi:DNA-binding transcriptional LysR family regulator